MHRLFAFLTFAPIVAWLICIAGVLLLSVVFDCTIHEGFANPCVVLERDVGKAAYSLGVFAAWGGLLVVPISMGAALIWAITAMIARWSSRNR